MKDGLHPGDFAMEAWKQEKLIKAYDARKQLVSKEDTAFNSPVGKDINFPNTSK